MGDLAVVIGQLIRPISGFVDDDTREQATRRFVELTLDGLRVRPVPRLPGEPLTTAAIADVAAIHRPGRAVNSSRTGTRTARR